MQEIKDDKYLDPLTATYTQQDGVIEERRFSASGRRVSITDAVFGDIQEGGPNYRDVRTSLLRLQSGYVSHVQHRLVGWEHRFS